MQKLLLNLAVLLALGANFEAYGAAADDSSKKTPAKRKNPLRYDNMLRDFEKSGRIEELEAIVAEFNADPDLHSGACLGMVEVYIGGEYAYGRSKHQEFDYLEIAEKVALARKALAIKIDFEHRKRAGTVTKSELDFHARQRPLLNTVAEERARLAEKKARLSAMAKSTETPVDSSRSEEHGDGTHCWDVAHYRSFIADYYSAPTLAKISELEHRVTTGLENGKLSAIYCSIILRSLNHGRYSNEFISGVDPETKERCLLDTIAEEKAAMVVRPSSAMAKSPHDSSSSPKGHGGGGSAGGSSTGGDIEHP